MSDDKPGIFARIAGGLRKSSAKIGDGLAGAFTKKPLDDEALDAFEETLIAADLGVETAAALRAQLAKARFGQETSEDDAARFLVDALAELMTPHAAPLRPDPDQRPYVVMALGVNGSGKTTTLGKLAARWTAEGRRVVMGAGDTFRAAAIEQLQAWGNRTGVPVIAKEIGSDAGALAFEAHQAACEANADVLLLDTAGRLQNKAALMDELAKIVRVLQKRAPDAPHEALLVLDGTSGANAVAQARAFAEVAPVTGLAVTKLDGTARGGAVVAAARAVGLPVRLIGVGESAEDLHDFDARAFAEGLVGTAAG